MNERVKELRKALGLSGEKFGATLGVKRSAISDIETGRNNLTEQMLKLICSTYNVSEQWLRSGEGNMFRDSDSISLDDFIQSATVDKLETEILKAYFSLDKDIRAKAIAHFKEFLSVE